MDDAYEAVFLCEGDDSDTVEILGRRTEADAVNRARQIANQRQVAVNLYRVAFLAHQKLWRDDQRRLVRQFLPTQYASRPGAS